MSGRTLPRRALTADLLSLAALLAIMVAANRDWLFNAFRWVDTWMYVGFFRHYDFAPMLAENKKIARLPWILLGYIVNRATSPVAAQYILHLGMLAAGTAALYLVLLRQFGRAVAVVIAAFYITYVPGHASGGWDYNNTPSALLYVLTYAALLNFTEQLDRPRQGAIVLGVAGATLVHTNLLYILVVPALVWLVAVRVRVSLSGPALKNWIKQAAIGFLAGGVGLTIVLGVINLIVGREFIFSERLVGRSALLIMEPDREKVWWRPWSHPWWYDSHDLPLNGYHMPLIFVATILIVLAALHGFIQKTRPGEVQKQAIGVFLLSLLIFAILQSTGHPLLQPYYMAFPLLVPTFFAIAALMSMVVTSPTTSPEASWNAGASLFICLLFGVTFIELSAMPASWHFGRLLPYDNLLSIAPIVLAFVVAWVVRPPAGRPARWRTAAALGVLSISMAATNAEWPSDPAYRDAYSFREQCRMREPTFELIMQADRFLFPRVKAGNYVPLAYRSGEVLKIEGCEVPLAEVARPLASMGYDVVMPYWKMEAAPGLPDDVIDQTARERTMIAVVTRDASYRDSILGRLRERVPEWHIDSESSLGSEATGAKIWILSRPKPARRAGG